MDQSCCSKTALSSKMDGLVFHLEEYIDMLGMHSLTIGNSTGKTQGAYDFPAYVCSCFSKQLLFQILKG